MYEPLGRDTFAEGGLALASALLVRLLKLGKLTEAEAGAVLDDAPRYLNISSNRRDDVVKLLEALRKEMKEGLRRR